MSFTPDPFSKPPSNSANRSLPVTARVLTSNTRRSVLVLSLLLASAVGATTALSVAPLTNSSATTAKTQPSVASVDRSMDAGNTRFLQLNHAVFSALLPQPLLAGDPVITFYKSDCTTPETVFEADDTVCAKVEGVNPAVQTTHIEWVNPSGAVLSKSTDITVDGSTRSFTLSPTASTGSWQAILVDRGAIPRATSEFIVTDPDNRKVDLSVNNRAQEQVTAGNDITYRVVVFNNGPDTAENVVITEPVPENTTFVAVSQFSGPQFSCAHSNGVITCTISAMPANTYAIFSTTYNVLNTLQTGTTLTSSVTASNTVTESNGDDNSASVDTVTANSPCVVSCGENITVPVDAGQGGAVVNYTAPTSTGGCGTNPVTCSQPSGSFFRIGTTPVTCAGDTGDACSFTVTVENPGALTITLEGDNPLALECGSVVITPDNQGFNDPGATAINGTGDPVEVVATGNVDTNTPGSYTVTYTATEGENSVSTTRTVVVADTTKPAIEIAGANPYRIQQGSCAPYADPGATARDGCEGPVGVTSSIMGPGGQTSVDNNVPGTYTVTYSATDGTFPATAERTVIVGNFSDDEVDQPSSVGPPTIRLNANTDNDVHQITVECGTTFNDPGATATACGAPVEVVVTGTADTNTPGTYTLTYTATNAAGSAEAHRTVVVVDTTPAVIVLNGADSMTVECGSAFTDPGATANDGCAGSLPVTAAGAVDTGTPGTYVITYSAPADPSGNPTADKTRTVIVADTLAPVITINGDNPATVECNTSYTDAGATANDGCNGPVAVTSSGSVDVNTPGTYTITYSATDGSHPATASRTVNVVDTTDPVVNCPANVTMSLPLNSPATSMAVTYPAATATDSCDSNVVLSYSHASGSVFPAGTTVVTVTATDDSGNESTCTFNVTVLYNFTGFFSPVGNLPTLNVVNAGKAVPVKFSLSGNKGLGILDPNPQSGVIPCDASAPAVDLTDTVQAGQSSLTYDATSDQYNYIWKTQSQWANTCRQLVITLNDGTTHAANFKFK